MVEWWCGSQAHLHRRQWCLLKPLVWAKGPAGGLAVACKGAGDGGEGGVWRVAVACEVACKGVSPASKCRVQGRLTF
jgi:hypothetical protein